MDKQEKIWKIDANFGNDDITEFYTTEIEYFNERLNNALLCELKWLQVKLKNPWNDITYYIVISMPKVLDIGIYEYIDEEIPKGWGL